MGVVDTWRKVRAQRPADTGRLAASLREDPASGLVQLVRFLASPDDTTRSADLRLAALEGLRASWRAAVAVSLDPLARQPLPFEAASLQAFHRTAQALGAVRDAYVAVHADLRADAPDAPPSPRALLALARALDAQSRLLAGACRLRVALQRDDWDTLCRLAFPLWTASALDEAFPEVPGPGMRRPGTPREAFATPLLLRLLEPLGLTHHEMALARSIAQATARGTGVRIDVDGRPHVCPDGPALMLSVHHTVQLDTRSTQAWIRRARERLSQGAQPAALGLRTVLGIDAVDALVQRLAVVWGPAHVPTPLVRPPLTRALLHVGLPRRMRPGESGSGDPLPAGDLAGACYVYGARRALPAAIDEPAALQAARDATVRALMAATGTPVAWRGQDARRSVFARAAATPRLRLGQLVAVLPHRGADRIERRAAPRPGSGPSRLLLGRVVTLAQTGVPDGREPYGHDVGVSFWPGTAVPVRVKPGAATAFEDAWWLPGGSEGGSVVFARDRFEGPCDALVREPGGDRRLRLTRLLERGVDFDRVEVAPAG